LFNLKTTPVFEKAFRVLVRLDKELQKRFIELLKNLRCDPYNINREYDIKKLAGIAKGGGQWRIRAGKYGLRYDIFGDEIVLHSIKHRKEAY
jgi:mRNA-degrading endonuclease RelE of RelBE toxin-antitoxin system